MPKRIPGLYDPTWILGDPNYAIDDYLTESVATILESPASLEAQRLLLQQPPAPVTFHLAIMPSSAAASGAGSSYPPMPPAGSRRGMLDSLPPLPPSPTSSEVSFAVSASVSVSPVSSESEMITAEARVSLVGDESSPISTSSPTPPSLFQTHGAGFRRISDSGAGAGAGRVISRRHIPESRRPLLTGDTYLSDYEAVQMPRHGSALPRPSFPWGMFMIPASLAFEEGAAAAAQFMVRFSFPAFALQGFAATAAGGFLGAETINRIRHNRSSLSIVRLNTVYLFASVSFFVAAAMRIYLATVTARGEEVEITPTVTGASEGNLIPFFGSREVAAGFANHAVNVAEMLIGAGQLLWLLASHSRHGTQSKEKALALLVQTSHAAKEAGKANLINLVGANGSALLVMVSWVADKYGRGVGFRSFKRAFFGFGLGIFGSIVVLANAESVDGTLLGKFLSVSSLILMGILLLISLIRKHMPSGRHQQLIILRRLIDDEIANPSMGFTDEQMHQLHTLQELIQVTIENFHPVAPFNTTLSDLMRMLIAQTLIDERQAIAQVLSISPHMSDRQHDDVLAAKIQRNLARAAGQAARSAEDEEAEQLRVAEMLAEDNRHSLLACMYLVITDGERQVDRLNECAEMNTQSQTSSRRGYAGTVALAKTFIKARRT